MHRLFCVVGLLMASGGQAADAIVILPVIASGKKPDWRAAGRMEKAINTRYGKQATVMQTAEASALNATLGREVIGCKGGATCLSAVLKKMNQPFGLYVGIKGRGGRARLTVLALKQDDLMASWTGRWAKVDAQVEGFMNQLMQAMDARLKEAAKPEAPAMQLAVMDLANKGGFTSEETSLVQGNIMALLQESKRFETIIGGADLRAMMDLEQQKTALGCGDTSCLAELGGALGVPYLMDMSLGRFAGQRVVNLSILHVDEARVLHRASRIFANDLALLAYLPGLVEELLQGAYGKGGVVLANDAKRVAMAQAAEAAERRKASARAHHQKPMVWVGAALLAGGGLGALLMPSDADLRNARLDYDAASAADAERKWNDFEGDLNQRQALGYAVPTLLSSGGLLAIWGLLSP